jgi:hypothetical protein
MILNEDDLDRITGDLVKKIGTEEPSRLFAERVMQSVYAVHSPGKKPVRIHYYWLFLIVPAIIAGGWYLSAIPELMAKSLKIYYAINLYFNSILTGLANTLHHLISISVSPLVLIGAMAVFFLMLIEAILTRKRFQIKKPDNTFLVV